MKNNVLAAVTAVLTAIGGFFVAKYALPAEAVNEVVAGLAAAITGAFGIWSAKRNPDAK